MQLSRNTRMTSGGVLSDYPQTQELTATSVWQQYDKLLRCSGLTHKTLFGI